ncbi:MAG: hypothetical protein ACOYVK_15890 [Bacillota bacterium]
MDATIRLGDLGIALIGIGLLVFIVYAIMILRNVNEMLKAAREIMEKNRTNIDKVLDRAPTIASNIESISTDLSHDVKAVQGTIDQLVGTSEVAAGVLAENTDVLASILGVIQLIFTLKETFTPFRRKRRWF